MAAADYYTVVQQLYVAYFGRPADPLGLANFSASLNAAGAPTTVEGLMAAYSSNAAIKSLVDSFGTSTESANLYSGADNLTFINQIFNNVLGRDGQVAGLTFWANALSSGAMTRGNAALNIMVGALTNTTTQGLLDKQTVENKITVASNFTAAINDPSELLAYTGAAAATSARVLLQGVTNATDTTAYQTSVDASLSTIVTTWSGTVNVGETKALTTGVDTFAGTAKNDTFNALIDSATPANSTLTSLDTVDGGAGTDTISVIAPTNLSIAAVGTTISGVEVANFRAAGTVTVDTTAWTGLTKANVTQGTTTGVTAAATTDVTVSGASGAITVDGGNSVTATAAAGQNVAIGGTTVSAGAVTVNHATQGAGTIDTDGGTNVTVTASGVTTGDIDIGQGGAATDLASGTITVTSTGAAYTAATLDTTLGQIDIDGGTKVSVTQSATSSSAAAAADTANTTITQSAVNVDGGPNTTEVTVVQSAAVAAVNGVAAVAGVKQIDTVTFIALANTESVTVGGLTFTATKALTAAEVAAAFANLKAGATHGSSAASNGIYSGTFGAYTTGAVTTTGSVVTVDATASAAAATAAAIVVSDAAAANIASANKSGGTAEVAAVTGKMGVVGGAVTVDDNGDDKIATVTLDGYGAGSAITSDALATLNLSNSAQDVAVTNAAATTLALSVNNLAAGAAADIGGTYTTLNLAANGADSTLALTAAGVTTLAVSGSKAVSLTADLAAVKTVTVSGTAGLTLAAAAANTIESVNTTATTGAVTATIEGARATYTGGAGVDSVTLATDTAITKAISLGGGDDTLSFGTLTVTGSTAALAGGDGTDTLAMSGAAAGTLDNTTVFATQLSSFERLTINDAAAAATIDLANLGFTNYVTTSGTNAGTDLLTLNKLASGGTVVLTATGVVTAGVTDAATGTADVVNVVLSSAGNLAAGTFTAADVETVNLTSTDTDVAAGANANTLTLVATAAKAVTVAGNAALTLTMTGNAAVTSINGSAMTAGLTVTSANTTTATTITGGSGNDELRAATGTNAHTLVGGAGDDQLYTNAGLSTLTGGAGADVFWIGVASLNSSSYSTITDFGAGDFIEFAGADSFTAARITQADTAVFQDYANAAMNTLGAGDLAWFQFGGNTYIVMDEATTNSTTFINGEDFVVRLTGLVDLTNASFNNDTDSITI